MIHIYQNSSPQSGMRDRDERKNSARTERTYSDKKIISNPFLSITPQCFDAPSFLGSEGSKDLADSVKQ